MYFGMGHDEKCELLVSLSVKTHKQEAVINKLREEIKSLKNKGKKHGSSAAKKKSDMQSSNKKQNSQAKRNLRRKVAQNLFTSVAASSFDDRTRRGQSMKLDFPGKKEVTLQRLQRALGDNMANCSLNNKTAWKLGSHEEKDVLDALYMLTIFFTDVTKRRAAFRKKKRNDLLLDSSPTLKFTDDLSLDEFEAEFDYTDKAEEDLTEKLRKCVSLLARHRVLSDSMSSLTASTNDTFCPTSLVWLTVKHPGSSINAVTMLRSLEMEYFDHDNVAQRNRQFLVSSQYAARQMQRALTAFCYSEDVFGSGTRIYADNGVLVGILIDAEKVFMFMFKHRDAFEVANGKCFIEQNTSEDGLTRFFDCNVVFRMDFFALGMFTSKQVGCYGFTPRDVNSKASAYGFLFLLCKDNAANTLLYAKPWFDKVQSLLDNGFETVDEHDKMVKITFNKAIVSCDGKAINEICQCGGSFSCALCMARFKEPKFTSALECSICVRVYGKDNIPQDQKCEHTHIPRRLEDRNQREQDDVEERDAIPDNERLGGVPQAPTVNRDLQQMGAPRGAPRNPLLPSPQEITKREEPKYFHFMKDKKDMVAYIQKLEKFDFMNERVDNTRKTLDDVHIKSMSSDDAATAIAEWYRTVLVKRFARRTQDVTIHTITVSLPNLDRLGVSLGCMLSSLPLKKSVEEIVEHVAAFKLKEQRDGDGQLEAHEDGLTDTEKKFNLYQRALLEIYCNDHEANGGVFTNERTITPLLRDAWRIVICLLHLRLRVSEKLIRLLVFAVLESRLPQDVKVERIKAMEAVINEICSKKLSVTSFFNVSIDLKKSGGFTVNFNLQGNKLSHIFTPENLEAFIKAGLHDDDTVFTGNINQTKFIELFKYYGKIIERLSKSDKVQDPSTKKWKTKYTPLTEEENVEFQKTADDFGHLYKSMFATTEVTPYLHWIFSGHGFQTIDWHGCIKDSEGQAWEAFMGELKHICKNGSTRNGGKTDAGGILESLSRYNMHKLVFNCVNSCRKPPNRTEHKWFFDACEDFVQVLRTKETGERKARGIARNPMRGGIPEEDLGDANEGLHDDDNFDDEEMNEDEFDAEGRRLLEVVAGLRV
jgi:hypothetical protein